MFGSVKKTLSKSQPTSPVPIPNPKVHLPNPPVSTSASSPRRISLDNQSSPAKVHKNEKLRSELQHMQRAQLQRRLHPAMMFPFHVPGPKQDNIYIGPYVGSDTDSEPETSANENEEPSEKMEEKENEETTEEMQDKENNNVWSNSILKIVSTHPKFLV